MTSGAAGVLYGNHNAWDDGTNCKYESTYLDTACVAQLDILHAFFNSLPWYDLVPDQARKFVTAGYGTFASTGPVQGKNYVTAALTSEGTTAVIYLPTRHINTVNLTRMSGAVTAQWFDPPTVGISPSAGSPIPASIDSLHLARTGTASTTGCCWCRPDGTAGYST